MRLVEDLADGKGVQALSAERVFPRLLFSTTTYDTFKHINVQAISTVTQLSLIYLILIS